MDQTWAGWLDSAIQHLGLNGKTQRLGIEIANITQMSGNWCRLLIKTFTRPMHVLLGMVAGFLRENQVEAILPLWLNLRSHSASFPSQLQMSTQVQGEETPSLPVMDYSMQPWCFLSCVSWTGPLSFWVCLWGCFQMRLTIWIGGLSRWPSSTWLSFIPSTGGLSRTKSRNGWNLPLFPLPCC